MNQIIIKLLIFLTGIAGGTALPERDWILLLGSIGVLLVIFTFDYQDEKAKKGRRKEE